MTTLNDLKKWPRLYELALKYQAEDSGRVGVDHCALGFFWGDRDYVNKSNFWVNVINGDFDAARALHPELFEEPVMEFIPGRKYRLLEDDGYGWFGNHVGREMVCKRPCGIGAIFYVDDQEVGFLTRSTSIKNARFEPVEDEPIPEQEECGLQMYLDSKKDDAEFQEALKKTPEPDWNKYLEEMFDNEAMLTRDGPEEVKPEPEVKPNPHSEALARAIKVTPFEISKFSPRGM